ncbi:class D beta-lactamase [Cyclobacterium jeungdonense]|uniref:Beta-lactamase n=1 Tax=Cyclobacterium jeungdonense TaxID=708087 RepID=A0ABT8C829_9BACT|nr:class D beta-lactamase [Cyclobacterium jeungdonense]MDN3688924.1 class D beta-lactamase [Cyclobacterium jeungdonense]
MLRKKYLTLMLLTLGLFMQVEAQEELDKQVHPDFQQIMDSAGLHGILLVADFQGSRLYSNDFSPAEQGQLPASTFKIPHSLIALDLGIVEDATTVFPWEGEERAMSQWERDLTFRQAFHLSCVPCYQGIARQIGVERMRDYLSRLDYGQMDVRADNLDQFWLRGQSRISPMEQVGFLRRLYQGELKLAPETLSTFREMMVIEESGDYRLSGKTGWSVDQGVDNGWFVGYLEKGGAVYFFASNLAPGPAVSDADFLQARKGVTMEALQVLGFL